MYVERTTIATSMPNLRLVALTPDDADAYYDLVDRNRGHLTQHGDYLDLGEATPESVAAELSDPENRNIRFGVWLDDHLIARVDLNPRTSEDFVLGYWLGSEYTGKGYGTLACQALIDYGKEESGAKTVWAGVTKGNVKSEALLGRLGFQAVSDQGAYTRFKLTLAKGVGLTAEQTTSWKDYCAMIRPAVASEADTVHALVRAAYERWIERFGREPSPMGIDYGRRIADGQAWVLEAEGEIVGLIELKDGPEALQIPNIAVAPTAQGKGHGRRLIAFAEEEARRRGYGELRLFVNTLMVENIALYQHLGFVEIGRIQGEGSDRAYLCMMRGIGEVEASMSRDVEKKSR